MREDVVLQSASEPLSSDIEKSQSEKHTAQSGIFSTDASQIRLEDDELPQNWPTVRKWFATITIALMSATVTFASSMHAPAVESVSKSLRCSETISTLGVTTYLVGLSFGPLVFGPYSEIGGRRVVFVYTVALFIVFNICCAVSPNIAALLLFRCLSGFFGSTAITNGGGCLVDIWPPNYRSVPFAIFTTGGSFGPVLAPMVGGFISQYLSWRWHYWVITFIAAPVYLAMLFLLPETYAPFLLTRKQHKAGIKPPRQSLKERYAIHLTRPWMMLFTEPILFTLSLYSSFLWGILYLDFTAFPVVFRGTRHWTPGMTGLSFLSLGLGILLAASSSPFINKIHTRYVLKLGGPFPEARLPHLIVLAWFIPVTLFWFGWTANPPTHWAVSISSGVPFGYGFLPLFLGTTAYLTDCYGRYSASGLAAFGLMRGMFCAGFPMFGKTMYVKLGTPWATSLLGFISLAMAPIPFLFYKYGPWLRERSAFHLATIKLELEEEEARRERNATN